MLKGLSGTFRTPLSKSEYTDPTYNPEGLFNFQFEFVSCSSQHPNGGTGASAPFCDTLNRDWADKVHFAILNGDWIYEEEREYASDAWMHQVRADPDEKPKIVEMVPAIVGVWENYKPR